MIEIVSVDLGALNDLPVREFSAVLSVLIFGLILVAWWLGRRHPTSYAMRLSLIALVLFAALRVYSATSYIWGFYATPEVFGVARVVVVATLTIIFILVAAVVAYFVRLARR